MTYLILVPYEIIFTPSNIFIFSALRDELINPSKSLDPVRVKKHFCFLLYNIKSDKLMEDRKLGIREQRPKLLRNIRSHNFFLLQIERHVKNSVKPRYQ